LEQIFTQFLWFEVFPYLQMLIGALSMQSTYA